MAPTQFYVHFIFRRKIALYWDCERKDGEESKKQPVSIVTHVTMTSGEQREDKKRNE